MAKDPAFLFYSSDFLTGVMFLDMKERGEYITLLCVQHQKGFISKNEMETITKSENVKAKFIFSENGFYNNRLLEESEKRKKYSASRAENRRKKENLSNPKEKDMLIISKSYDEHMENENENENRDLNFKNNKELKEKYFNHFWDAYPSRNGKKAGKQEAKDKFFTLKESDYQEIIQNAKNYGINNEYPKDPARFLKNNFWKDWSTPMVVQETRKFESAMERTNRVLQEEQEKTERMQHASKLREFRPRQSFDIQESDFKAFPESESPDIGQFFRAEN